MLFGLANALVIFQSYIDRVLHHLIDVKVIIYLDNILIFSEDESKYKDDVKEVL